jgi:hypothetical protein
MLRNVDAEAAAVLQAAPADHLLKLIQELAPLPFPKVLAKPTRRVPSSAMQILKLTGECFVP